jgi:hypothetical protein
MSKRTTDPREHLKALLGLDDDFLDPACPDALVEDELRRAGGDPHAIGERGAAFVARLASPKAAASTTRLRSTTRGTSSSPPAHTMPPIRPKTPSENGPINEE